MTKQSRAAHPFLPGFILAACVALPAGASAQTMPPTTGTGALSAAMAEARRTPFHNATAGVESLVTVRLGEVRLPHAGQAAPDSATVSFHWIFWPTAIGTFLSDLAFVFGVFSCYGEEDCTLGFVMGTAALILGPPTTARIAGGSFGKGVLGSLAGIGLTAAVHEGLGMPDEAFWLYPFAHALVTTAAAMR